MTDDGIDYNVGCPGRGHRQEAGTFFEWFGRLGMFCARLMRAALTRPYEIGELIHQCDEIGSKSLPLGTGGSGRLGAGIGAELGSMRVTEQIDAMEASAVEPFRYLVATRVLACI